MLVIVADACLCTKKKKCSDSVQYVSGFLGSGECSTGCFEKRQWCKLLGLSIGHIPSLMFHCFGARGITFPEGSTINPGSSQSGSIREVICLSFVLFWLNFRTQDLKGN